MPDLKQIFKFTSCLILAVIVIFLLLQYTNLRHAIQFGQFVSTVPNNVGERSAIGELTQGRREEVNFTGEMYVSYFAIQFATWERENQGVLNVSFYINNELVFEERVDYSTVVDNMFHDFVLPEAVFLPPNSTATVALTVIEGEVGHSITAWGNQLGEFIFTATFHPRNVSIAYVYMMLFLVLLLPYGIVSYFWFFKMILIIRLYNKIKKSSIVLVSYKTEKNRYLLATFCVASLMALTYWLIPIRYYNVDDPAYMYIVAGYLTGVPSPFLLWSNIVFGYILSILYTLLPMFPWYGIVHVVFIFISQLMILKSFLKIAAQKDISLFVPISLYFVLFAYFLLYSTVTLQFSTTPAMMGAAACIVAASLFSSESKRARVVDFVTIVVLLFFSYIIRVSSGLGVLTFFYLVIAFKVTMTLLSRKTLKYMLWKIRSFATISICIAVVILLVRDFDLFIADFNGMREFRTWNSQWARYTNYLHTSYDDAPELYESIGWDRELYVLVQNAFTMDKRVTVENIRILNEFQSAELELVPFSQQLDDALGLVSAFVRNNNIARNAGTVLLLGFLAHIIVLKRQVNTCQTNKWKNVLYLLFALAVVGAFLLSLLWLGLRRINLRAFIVPLMPAACLLFWHVLYAYGSSIENGVKKHIPIALTFCFVIGFNFAHVPFRTAYAMATSSDQYMRIERRLLVERYAIENPDNVFILPAYILSSTPVPVFTIYRNQHPTNLIVWGTGFTSSPTRNAQFKANELAPYANSLLQPNVYFITSSTASGPGSAFVRYMENRYRAMPMVVDQFEGIFVIMFVQADQFFTYNDMSDTLYHADTISVSTDMGNDNVFIYSKPMEPNSHTNYVVTFHVETGESPESFWIEWYRLSPELHYIRDSIKTFDIVPGHHNYFRAIYTDNKEFDETAHFRIITTPTSDMQITDFTIVEVLP